MKVVFLPNAVLRKKSLDVEKIDQKLKKDLNLMIALMYESKGIGISAVQVGILKRFFVIDISSENLGDSNLRSLFVEDNIKYPLIVINPQIINISEEQITEREGCLSIPGIFVDVPRYREIKLTFLDLTMKSRTIYCKDLLARVVQHEYDHLNGKLIIDYLSYIKRDIIMKKIKKNS
ncbi:MAG: peptide deformylase [Rickettsia sp.]|nr:peptide deformylase [Rickettsia sp.]